MAWAKRCGEGLIPARAGKTKKELTLLTENEAHPRAGGENRYTSRQAKCSSGSSPRGRGKRVRQYCGQ